MSTSSLLVRLAEERLGSFTMLVRESGIAEQVLRDIAEGQVQPDAEHIKRVRAVLGRDVPDEAFPHARPRAMYLEVTEAKVLAKREELVVRPEAVKADDMIRLVSSHPSRGFIGWVKALKDAYWARADLVCIDIKGGQTVECHPAQTVTVARRPSTAQQS